VIGGSAVAIIVFGLIFFTGPMPRIFRHDATIKQFTTHDRDSGRASPTRVEKTSTASHAIISRRHTET
jgi:hypothetical protein